MVMGWGVFLLCVWTLPAWWCGRGAGGWVMGSAEVQGRLAQMVAREVAQGPEKQRFGTGVELFNGEWLFGTYLMAGVGLCQMVQQHPETAGQWNPEIERCIRQLLSDPVRAFDQKAWQTDPLQSLEGDAGHAAYLGYLNFLLGLYRQANPGNPFVDLNDRLTAALVRRLEKSPNGLIATYPDEWYPVDNAPGIASIALHARNTSADHAALLVREEKLFRERYIDPKSGLLVQAVSVEGTPCDVARGSGTALGAFFLSRAYPWLGYEMYQAIRKNLGEVVVGFGAVREYPGGVKGGRDIDSGPIVFGLGFSATGFTLGLARGYEDASFFGRLYASAVLAGAPVRSHGRLNFVTGGPLGNAILLAMLTTPHLK